MASHKTNKRSYKKRTPKRKTQKGGDIKIFGYTCKKDEEEINNNEEVQDEEPKVEEEMNEADVETEVEEVDEEEEEEGREGGGKKGRKAKKSTKKVRVSHKKNRKTMKKKGKSAWTAFVVELYRKNKQKNPLYMFKNALSDAAKIYKK